MNLEERRELIRKRAEVLFPKGKPIAPQPPTREQIKRRLRAKETRPKHVRAFYTFGVSTADHAVLWVAEPDQRKQLLVAPFKRRCGAPALAIVAEKLKPGTNAPDNWWAKPISCNRSSA